MTNRDKAIGETHETEVITAFEGDVPAGTRTPSALRHRIRNAGPAVVAFVLVIALWEAATRVFNIQAFILPAPSVILDRFIATSDIIWGAGLNTFIEAISGLVGGTLLGAVCQSHLPRCDGRRFGKACSRLRSPRTRFRSLRWLPSPTACSLSRAWCRRQSSWASSSSSR